MKAGRAGLDVAGRSDPQLRERSAHDGLQIREIRVAARAEPAVRLRVAGEHDRRGPALVRQVGLARQVDGRDLEQRDTAAVS